jgi:hypothetical protein
VPTVCCLYPGVDGPSYYERMAAWTGPGEFVWHVLPYHQPYRLVEPPRPPYQSQCVDATCTTFLKLTTTAVADTDNLLAWDADGPSDCRGWKLVPSSSTTFTIPTTGLYEITANLAVETPYPPPGTMSVGYSVNGGAIQYQAHNFPDSVYTTVLSSPRTALFAFDVRNVALNAGDVVRIYCKPAGTGCTLKGLDLPLGDHTWSFCEIQPSP